MLKRNIRVVNEWIGIRPGTDGLFAFALIHELLKADRIDLDYLVRYTNAMADMYGPLWSRVDRTNPEGERFMLLLGLRKVKVAEEGVLDTWIRGNAS